MHKVSISSMRVLQMLQLLFEKSYTMNELMDAMSELTGEACTNFLISKYINTCRFCGIDIQKINGKYTLLKIPFGYLFSEDELVLLNRIADYCSSMRASKTVRNINSVITKINQHSDKYYAKVTIPEDDKRVIAFEEAIARNNKVELIYLEGDEEKNLVCEPYDITYDDEGLCFIVYDDKDSLRIPFMNVLDIKVTKLKNFQKFSHASVTFVLKNVLAKRYTLRPEEKIIDEFDPVTGGMSVLNVTEDKQTLLSRLMKYAELCEVRYPIVYRKEMLNIIDKTLENYK